MEAAREGEGEGGGGGMGVRPGRRAGGGRSHHRIGRVFLNNSNATYLLAVRPSRRSLAGRAMPFSRRRLGPRVKSTLPEVYDIRVG